MIDDPDVRIVQGDAVELLGASPLGFELRDPNPVEETRPFVQILAFGERRLRDFETVDRGFAPPVATDRGFGPACVRFGSRAILRCSERKAVERLLVFHSEVGEHHAQRDGGSLVGSRPGVHGTTVRHGRSFYSEAPAEPLVQQIGDLRGNVLQRDAFGVDRRTSVFTNALMVGTALDPDRAIGVHRARKVCGDFNGDLH